MASAGARARRSLTDCARVASVVAAALPAISLLGLAACGDESEGDDAAPREVAAVVAGAEIAVADVDELAARYLQQAPETGPSGSPLAPLDEQVARRFVLNYLIRLTFLNIVAEELGIEAALDPSLDIMLETVTPEEFSELNMAPDDMRQAVRAGNISKQIALRLFPEVAVSEDKVRTAYEAQARLYEAGWTAVVHTAFLGTREEAEDLRSAVGKGSSFLTSAELLGALEHGSMGEVTSASPLPPDILAAIAELAPGEVSEPIQASIGWLLFYIESRTDVAETEYPEARQEILATLEDQERQRLFDDWFRQRLAEAEVEVDSFYGRWNPSSGTIRSS